jgi:enoyl-CoA hydratase
MSDQNHLIIEHRGPVGLITLNRPEALNALSLGMIRGIREVLAQWRDQDDIRMIVFLGAGERAFCAGGDVKKVYEAGAGITDPDHKATLAKVYFAEEYRMNREMHHYPKPLIAFMNGITMGGGFGVAGACALRIASENTVFAMPEVGIGLFPDVGSMYTLTRCPRRTGYWLALTGETIRAADMMPMGIATHYMRADRFPTCLEQMVELGDPSILDQFSDKPDSADAKIFPHEMEIDAWFGAGSVETILENLDRAGTPLAEHTAKIMRMRSPTSLKLTHAYLLKMQGADFNTVTAMDYRLSIRCMLGHEFYEGIRAALIDKDKKPQWNPATLAGVDDDIIENYFAEDLPNLDQAL